MSHRALATIHVGKPDEAVAIHGGAVFRPDELGLDKGEVKRLIDRGLLEESDLELWANPTAPLTGSSTILGPLQSSGVTPLILPTRPQAPPEPVRMAEDDEAGRRSAAAAAQPQPGGKSKGASGA